MAQFSEEVWCAGCGVEITWGPVVREKRMYCCQDCADGLECECGARMEFDDERRAGTPIPGPAAGIDH